VLKGALIPLILQLSFSETAFVLNSATLLVFFRKTLEKKSDFMRNLSLLQEQKV